MITTKIGRDAEAAVADHLTDCGYKMIERNYRTKVCEIDIVAKKDGAVYFVEVKFRASDSQGDGLEYITPKKLRQLRFAAEIWVQEHQWGGDYRIMAAAVSSENADFRVDELVDLS